MRLFLVLLLFLGNCSTPPPETRRTPWLYPAQLPSEHSFPTTTPPSSPPETTEYDGYDPEEPPHSSSNDNLVLQWPVPATAITSLYGPRADPLQNKNSFHYGVDLECPYGTVVKAAASGTISKAGWNKGHGRQIIIHHDKGYRTIYSHLSQILVSNKDAVSQGQAIGRVGNSGRSTGPHLHLEVLKNHTHVDPLNHLDVALR